jgi:hypothetical protein
MTSAIRATADLLCSLRAFPTLMWWTGAPGDLSLLNFHKGEKGDCVPDQHGQETPVHRPDQPHIGDAMLQTPTWDGIFPAAGSACR